MAGRVTFRVLFGGEDDARKLPIESGIPRTVEDLALKIKTFFHVTEEFRLQYKDKDMNDQFMNLLSISELEDKGTLKVVYILNETTRSAPLTEDAFGTIPGIPSNASSSSQEPSDSDSYLNKKMLNFRTKPSRAAHPKVAINSLKNKRSDQQTPAANIKKPRKGDVNFCPNIPSGETREGLEVESVALLTEVKQKKKDEAVIKEKMQRTFSLRKQEILQEPKIPEFLNKWPALFDVSEINLEFMRLTAVPLTSKFLGELDRLTDDLIRVFHTKGGAAGIKIRAVMAKTDNSEDINVRRDCVLSCLSIYLDEDLDTLVKEYVDIECREAVAGTTVGIYTVRAESDDPDGPAGRFADVGVVLEGVEVLHNLQSINHACVMLYGLIYALNLSYPKSLKNTFEVYQKILMDLESSKLSPKVQALKLKLLRLSMAAYDILRRNKTSIVETLGADYTLILNKAYENKLITQCEYKTLKSINKENDEGLVLKLVDTILKKGEETRQLFLDLLQTDEIQDTFPELKNILEDEPYELKSQPTGLCLIINNKHFHGGNVRDGTDKDAVRLGEVFSWLGFRVLMCTDQTKDQMERALECFASQCDLSQLQEVKVQEWIGSGFTDLRDAPRHGDAFICCLLSHGDKGVVLGVDGEPLPIKDITRIFMAAPHSPLSAKPKVFLIQACQGGKRHPKVELKGVQADYSPSTFIPQGADFLVHSSTVEDYYSMRDPTKGSWFIQSVCEQLEVGCERNEEIEDILRRVNKEVARKECVLKGGPTKQMPAIWHTLRKPLVLTPHLN